MLGSLVVLCLFPYVTGFVDVRCPTVTIDLNLVDLRKHSP